MMKQLATQNARPGLIARVLYDSKGFALIHRQVLQTIEVAKLANTISATHTLETQTSCMSNTDHIYSYLQINYVIQCHNAIQTSSAQDILNAFWRLICFSIKDYNSKQHVVLHCWAPNN